MKLLRLGELGKEKIGLWIGTEENGKIIDVSAFGKNYDRFFFENDGINLLKQWFEQNGKNCPVVLENISIKEVAEKIRLANPVTPSKIVCIGLNYAKHAKESGLGIPKEPVVFFKSTTAIIGPNDNVVIPKNSTKTDWEVELAFVIGKKASYVEKEQAMDYVAGYVLHNDISERSFQLEREGQWVKGKSCDTFAPMGPWLATKEEITEPHNLNLWLEVNGKRVQNSNTNDLIFDIPTIVSYLSQFFTLLPGDVISTGTPYGAGFALNPPQYLKQDDTMELGINGLGIAKQKVISYHKK